MEIDIKKLRNSCKVLKLLYVEDDVNARKATLHMFKHFFNDITEAVDGEDGLKKFKDGDFDLIISDINMPKMNGLEMLKEIRNISKDVPFLLLSAYSENKYFTESISLGVDYFIIKPIQQRQLYQALSNIIEKIRFKELSQHYQEQLEGELTKRTDEIRKKLYEDDLTGLGSRYAFFEDLKSFKEVIVYLIDIEKFHLINDMYGHEFGNRILEDFAELLKDFAQKAGANIYRLSGDEFAIMKEERHLDTEKHETLIEDFYNSLKNKQFNYETGTIKLHMHIGIAFGTEKLFERASIALDYAKAHSKDYLFYSSENDRTQEQHRISEERHMIQSAIDNEDVVAVYQAIVDKDRNICKYETLMRLKSDGGQKLVTPFHFLSTAVKTGQYDILSIEVIKQGLNLIQNSEHALSFNFTYSDIVNKEFLRELELFFKSVPEAGSRVIFEITENESMESYDIVKDFINKFRKYGVRIAIDDFGTGFSNFNYILEMEPDYLKIDGSLIKDIDTNSKSLTLTEAIVNFSKKLGIKVIAEFVHNEEIFLILKDIGVDEFQGFYFAQPVPKENL